MKFHILSALILMCLIVSSCRMPYDTPEFEEIGAKETVFVIPLESDTEDQSSFASAELLEKRKVSSKRIPIPKKWVATGRRGFFGIGHHKGKYIPLVTVIRVDRTPVTMTWSLDAKNKVLEAESRDSIGVASGFTITAWIEELDAHIFLHRYQGVPLSQILDTQIFNSIQTIYSETCSKYDLKELRSKKQEITDEIRKRVIPFYKQWGITIAEDCGLYGGIAYENPEIQKAINDVFIAQQQEQRNEALAAAQEKENLRLRSVAENQSQIVMIEAAAEAGRIREISQAISDNTESYLALQQLRLLQEFINNGLYVVQEGGKRVPVWDGKLPTILNLGSNASPSMLLGTDLDSLKK